MHGRRAAGERPGLFYNDELFNNFIKIMHIEQDATKLAGMVMRPQVKRPEGKE